MYCVKRIVALLNMKTEKSLCNEYDKNSLVRLWLPISHQKCGCTQKLLIWGQFPPNKSLNIVLVKRFVP